MTETAVGSTRIHEDDPAWMRWRDAITPATRASRRRWVLFYPIVLLFAGAQFCWGERLGLSDGASFPTLTPIVLLFVVFGMLRRSTRSLTAVDHPDLDERDQLARAEAFRLAYPILLLVLLASGGLLAAVPADDVTDAASVFLGLGLWLLLWWVFLPTATLAWREPDPVDERAGGGPPELVRDLILLVGFVVALAMETAAVGNGSRGGAGLYVLVPTLCLVAAWVRHGAGQQAVGTHIWGLGVLCVAGGSFVPIGVLTDSGASASAGSWAWSAAMLAAGLGIAFVWFRERRI